MKRKPISKKEKGFVIITGGLMMLFVIPVVGLAIDAGFLYAVKARLQSATDAASLAAARSLAVGMTLADQEASARARAIAFFDANYPPGLFNTTDRNINVDVSETAFRTRTVTVTATVDSPLFFMRILNNASETVVAAVGRASRRDVNVIMVIDRSGSMNTNGGCAGVRNAANGFVDLFANQRDRLGMITYGVAYALSYAPNMNFKSSSPTITSVINSIACNGGTGTAQAFFQGYQQIANINEPGALNVVLLFTDGIPNTVTANFPTNILDTTRVADGGTIPSGITPRNSRCYDWNNNKRWYATATPGVQQATWNPAQQVFRGAIFAEGTTLMGINGYTTTNFTDPGQISRPFPNETSTTLTTGGNTNDCWFRGGSGHTGSGRGTNQQHVQYDIAFYPDNDLYGTPLSSNDGFQNVNRYPWGHVYANRINVNSINNMNRAAKAAVDNVGKRIRANELRPDVNTVVYAIGLGNVGDEQHMLLRRVSNDPTSPIYDPNKLEGLYVFAPTAADLNAAFVKIASEILRYAQ